MSKNSNLLSSHKQDHAEHLLAGWAQGGLLSNEREVSHSLYFSQVRDEHSSAVWQPLSDLSFILGAWQYNSNCWNAESDLLKCVLQRLHSWAVRRLQSHEKMQVFYLNLKQRSFHWLTLMTTAVPHPRCITRLMKRCLHHFNDWSHLQINNPKKNKKSVRLICFDGFCLYKGSHSTGMAKTNKLHSSIN